MKIAQLIRRSTIIINLISVSVFSQAGRFLETDYAVFNYDESLAYVDLNYALLQSKLTAQEDNGVFTFTSLLQISVDKDGAVWMQRAWKNQNTIDDTTEGKWRVYQTDKESFLAPEGRYRICLKAQDLNAPALIDSAILDLTINPFKPGQPALSDVILASSVKKDPEAKDHPFYRNTLVVIPNPALLFGKNLERVFYYLESYYLKNILGSSYQITYYITDKDNRPVEQITPVRLQRKNTIENRVENGAISVRSLPTGGYLFKFELSDSAGNLITEKSKPFFVYYPDADGQSGSAVQMPVSHFRTAEFEMMSEEELDRELAYIQYLISDEQKKIVKSLTDVNGKRNFLAQVWHALDSKPETPENKFRSEYLARIEDANKSFKAMKRDGWKTDRGRVLMIYGPPSSIEAYPYKENSKPYEIWYYNEIQGGVQFVFCDLMGFKNYELIHSSALGEIHNKNFENIIQGEARY
jgi:GWxTD domain-containing protein